MPACPVGYLPHHVPGGQPPSHLARDEARREEAHNVTIKLCSHVPPQGDGGTLMSRKYAVHVNVPPGALPNKANGKSAAANGNGNGSKKVRIAASA